MRSLSLPLPLLLVATSLSPPAAAQNFQYDHRTTPDCADWVDISDATTETCNSTLSMFGLSPARFRAWNPSVGLDCAPWFNFTSYCVVTHEVLDTSVYYTTRSDGLRLASLTTDSEGWTVPATRSDASLRPSPTARLVPEPSTWKEMGCFVETWDPERADGTVPSWALEFRHPDPDPQMSLAKCVGLCFHMQFRMAGVRRGDECWCSDTNNGTRADAGECDTPCPGDARAMCGGKERISLVGAEDTQTGGSLTTASASGTAAGTGSATGSAAGSAAASSTASSGARRNQAMLWW